MTIAIERERVFFLLIDFFINPALENNLSNNIEVAIADKNYDIILTNMGYVFFSFFFHTLSSLSSN